MLRVRRTARPILTRPNMAHRVMFVSFMLQNPGIFRRILFTDECTVKLRKRGDRVFVWVTRLNDPLRFQAERANTIRVDVSGGISIARGRTQLTKLRQATDHVAYEDIMRNVYVPHILDARALPV